MKLTDIDLPAATVALARDGDRASLAAFYAACAGPAYTLIRRIVPGPAADDLLQDSFVAAIRGLADFKGDAPLGAWFRSIVVRRCLMHLRSPWQRRREWLDDWIERIDAATSPAPSAGLELDLERALRRLPALTRLIVWLHDVEGYTHEEIAQLTAHTSSASKSQLSRAHARLRAWLAPESAPASAPVGCARSVLP